VVVEGHLAPSDAPGWGVDLDEKAAAEHPPVKFLHERWATGVRHPDGGLDAP
jgi:mannonate dehydratase